MLAAGDAVILMSDGFPEMFNEKREMFDYTRVVNLIRETGPLPAQEIIDGLAKAGEAWAGNRPQDDDVTFVVIKSK